ncbi:MAG: hypothetical protein CR982_05415 [Candidatus Cloacimonadota bacterium]|nr:MAG: hypothetical protein CR982_05415 [Candidatus Cloacimonadota bacterium]PIE77594.1 MAG: hypothetical protein CSA15_12210 [Candidatus Delongbacteria bacterium]
MRKLGTIITLIVMGLLYSNEYNLGVKFGTKGIGIDGGMEISEQFKGRVSIDYSSFYSSKGQSNNTNGFRYDADLYQLSLGALADWHPFENGFRVTGGVYYLDHIIEGVCEARKSYSVGTGACQLNYLPEDLGKVYVDATLNHVAPYFGIGYNSNFYSSSRWSISVDFGVLYSGSPKFEVESDGVIKHTKDELEPLLNDDFEEFRFFPELSLGISYKI